MPDEFYWITKDTFDELQRFSQFIGAMNYNRRAPAEDEEVGRWNNKRLMLLQNGNVRCEYCGDDLTEKGKKMVQLNLRIPEGRDTIAISAWPHPPYCSDACKVIDTA